MSESTTHFKVGLFVLGGLLLGVGLVLYVGADELRRGAVDVETYLEESVQGLEVGSPVKYRGLEIGQVESIDVVRNVYPDGVDDPDFLHLGRWMVVRMEIFDPLAGGGDPDRTREEFVREVEAGLRIRLASQGITGVAYMEVDYEEQGAFPPLAFPWTVRDEGTYVPSAPSTTTRFLESAEVLFTNLQDADVASVVVETREFLRDVRLVLDQLNVGDVSAEGAELLVRGTELFEELERAAAAVRARVESGEVDVLLSEATDAVSAYRDLAVTADDELTLLLADLRATSAEARDAAGALRDLAASEDVAAATGELPTLLARADQALLRLDLALAGADANTAATLDNLRAFSQNLRELSELAKQYPSLLLLGVPAAGDGPESP